MYSRLAIILFLPLSPVLAQSSQERMAIAFFEQNVRPVLVEKCIQCHGATKQESGLRLDSRAAMLKGGESGPALVPGQPDKSLLLEALKYESIEMPPSVQLTPRTIAKFRNWITSGAVWPATIKLRPPARTITDTDRDWWAFRSLKKPTVPAIKRDNWSQNEIDRFVLHRLNTKAMEPAPPATKRQLVRRAYFDLLGLPPTPSQIQAFVENESDSAWEEFVDQLLASPHYGEHWARHWLDIVRYAESDGWNQDAYRPHIWRYRDYVVKSFNEDKPWPEFVRQQLAGDEIANDNPENLAATGFLRLGIYEYNQRDARGQWNDIMNETTDVVGDVFLGIGMACARCHDHKFDPILQRDYFALRSFFEPIEWRDDLVYATDAQKQEHAKQQTEWEQKAVAVRKKIDDLLTPYHDRKWESTVEKFPLDIQACFNKPIAKRDSWEHQMAYLVSRQFEEEAGGPLKNMTKADKAKHEKLKKELKQFDSVRPKPLPKLMAATDFDGKPATTVIQDTKQKVEPAFLTVLRAGQPDTADQESRGQDLPHTTGRRTALANWIAQPDNPLTNRVIVNRIWQYHFGRGLVDSPNDFGHQGDRPAHPELLDWLTTTFTQNGGHFKRLPKRILMSATWRQSVTHPQSENYQRLDPNEDLLWRSTVRRLDAEQVRDAMLLVTGELDAKLGGASVTLKSPRRSLYIKSIRNKPDAFLHHFDMANGLKSVAQRNTTITPTQALFLINGPYPLARAKALAKRMLKEHDGQDATIRAAFEATSCRKPTEREVERALTFMAGSDPSTELDKLTDLCHILFNSNEFLYVD